MPRLLQPPLLPVPRPTRRDLYRVLWDERDAEAILAATGGRFTREELLERLEKDRRERAAGWAVKTLYLLLREIPEDGDYVTQWRKEHP